MVSLRIFYLVIAVSSIATNSFVCLVFFRNKTWLKRPYNVFIVSLAVTDILTGIMMFTTPGMIFEEAVPIPKHSMFFGTIYCKVLWGYWPIFSLGVLSVYTCLALTIERWTAICRPFEYKTRFASKQLAWYILAALTAALAATSIGAIEAQYHKPSVNFTEPRCIVKTLVEGPAIGYLAAILSALKFFSPSIVILILYGIAIWKLKQVDEFQIQNNRDVAIKNVTKMAAAASIALILLWTPNQIYYVLNKFRKIGYMTPFHQVSIIMVFINSTVYPFIYALWGKQFRTGIKVLIHEVCSKCPRFIRPTTESHVTAVGTSGVQESMGNKYSTGVPVRASPSTVQETPM